MKKLLRGKIVCFEVTFEGEESSDGVRTLIAAGG